MKYDFSGWATKNNIRCLDGLIIRKDAFKVNDGKKVPLVWNHRHDSSSDVLGHAVLENREEGVYAYCSFNNTQSGKDAKEAVKHGDVESLSIWANNLDRQGSDVLHGVIREVSLVLAGANPGAFIESVMIHGVSMGEEDDEGIFYSGEGIYIRHDSMSEESSQNSEDGKTVREVVNTMTDEQKEAMAILIGQALEEAGVGDDEDEDEEGEEMKQSIFNKETEKKDVVLSHSDMETIFANARRIGSLKAAVEDFVGDDGVLMHSIDTTGMETATGTQQYGFNDPSMLFPEYRSINTGAPEWISRNMTWVNEVMNSVHHTPFARIKSVFADITEDEARAKGYIKGNMKKEEFFTTLKRTTDPQTVYKKQKLDRDDIIDISDFDIVAWIKVEMRTMLNEEIARGILIGDGRPSDSEDKIKEDHIRPIAKESPLFNTVVQIAASTDSSVMAENTIDGIIKSRKHYKGSGNPTFFTNEDTLTEMLLLKDKNGRRIYNTETELATALRVKKIVTAEPLENVKVNNMDLIGIVVDLADYNVGTNRGGEINMFDDFDIDFNQQKYLIETRISGALIKPYSALTFVKGSSSGVSLN